METHEYHELIASIDELKRRVSALEASDVPVKMSRPTQDEVTAYCRSRQLTDSDAIWWYNKMVASGWKNNGKAVRSWKATIVTWDISKIFPSQKQGTNGNASVFGLKAALEAKERQARELSNRDYYPDQHQWSNESSRQQFIVLKKDIKSLTARIAQSV